MARGENSGDGERFIVMCGVFHGYLLSLVGFLTFEEYIILMPGASGIGRSRC